jgi:hypothetical protein
LLLLPPRKKLGGVESRRARLLVVWAAALIGAAALAFHEPIPQEPTDHRFADQRTVLGIPRAGDVFSNAALAAAGALGLAFLSVGEAASLFSIRGNARLTSSSSPPYCLPALDRPITTSLPTTIDSSGIASR